jgi:glycosyltransferase involved in cell wall biosynthesis
MSKKLISIVIPVFKEEKNIPLLYDDLIAILSTIRDNYDYEIIFVNDGSSDNSRFQIEKLCATDKNVK